MESVIGFAGMRNQAWGADITYLWTQQGWLYLAVVIDLYSRRVVGWSIDRRMKKALVLRALMMAVNLRKPPPGLLHHSDRGTQTGLKESSQHGFVEPIVSDSVKPPQEFSNQGPFSVAHSTSQQRHRVLLPKSD